MHPFIAERNAVFDELFSAHQAKIEALPKVPITITLINGDIYEGISNKTTPLEVAKKVKSVSANNVVTCKVNGELFHVNDVLPESCTIEFLGFDSAEGAEVFQHSAAHVLGATLEKMYGAILGVGPAVNEGFYYDARLPESASISSSDLKEIKKEAVNFAKRGGLFRHLEVTREDALRLFAYSPYKLELIREKVAEGELCGVYNCGSFVDFCLGPHVAATNRLARGFTVYATSSAYWRGDQANDSMQRVSGIAFPSPAELKQWEKRRAEIEKRNHQTIGTDQQLFLMHHLAPGCPIFLPNGNRIYRTLENLVRDFYWEYGYDEVQTPTWYNVDLWRTSGHWEYYKDDMFSFDMSGYKFGLKPMNCPGHCLIFRMCTRNEKDLPMRITDFGEVHRNELSGTLKGLIRVRRFHQDDGHIFCARSQIKEEILKVLEFVDRVYSIFRFRYKLGLSTRPEKRIGSDETWDFAENALREVLEETGKEYTLNEGDGAFYGPKIDIELFDAIGRSHQCATCQLDFNLPERFDLKYMAFDKETGQLRPERPVMVHRAVFGSLERFMAILIEHTAGLWPFWVSPRQAIVLQIPRSSERYANAVHQTLRRGRYFVDIDTTGDDIRKKIQRAVKAKYNYILIVGNSEEEKGTVNVRKRGVGPVGEMTVPELLGVWDKLVKEHTFEEK
eukprot:gnl/Chilomastix_cuspidata/252.p3 GENE.gnl/Chilomastix_cuspidata/252~~gnl/Chilomastix_cuspidata/252.p3  ORF type:complete len:675 (+),score=235.82 gnl/Chilomastix_cuspidata/252:27-2051(+)